MSEQKVVGKPKLTCKSASAVMLLAVGVAQLFITAIAHAGVSHSVLDYNNPFAKHAYPTAGPLAKPIMWKAGLWRVTELAEDARLPAIHTEKMCINATDWRKEALYCGEGDGCKTKLAIRSGVAPEVKQFGRAVTYWDGEVRTEAVTWITLRQPDATVANISQGITLSHFIEERISTDTVPTKSKSKSKSKSPPIFVDKKRTEYQWLGQCPTGSLNS